MKDFLYDILLSIRSSVQSHTDEAVYYATCDNIFKATIALIEAHVAEETIKSLLVKHWDLRPSEANQIFQEAMQYLSKNNPPISTKL